MKRFHALIFDFDGTLAHVPLDFDLMRRKIAALAEGFLLERPQVEGAPVLELVEELSTTIGESAGRDAALEFNCRSRLAITDMELRAAEHGSLFSFTRPMLDTLREHGLLIGVITRNITPAIMKVFPDIQHYVDSFIPRDDALQVKPHPAHLLQALQILDVEPQQALMVGDHPLDIHTGVRAGVAAAGVTTGQADGASFAEAGAEFVAADAGQLVEELRIRGCF